VPHKDDLMTANRHTDTGFLRSFGRTALATAGVLVVLSVAAQAAPRDTKAEAVKRGEMLAKENCASCHAIGLKGDSPNPKSPPFRTLSQRYQLEALEEALGEGITMGHGEANMPHFIFEPDDIGDLISYLKKINRR
jgi:cytochrome c